MANNNFGKKFDEKQYPNLYPNFNQYPNFVQPPKVYDVTTNHPLIQSAQE